jgi:predicted glycogen debranching enzyme
MLHLAEIDFGRAICGDPQAARRREWLVTNGIGGFACGTISGELTRRYHGLLVAALEPPLGRTLLAVKFNERLGYQDQTYDLSTNRMAGDQLVSHGYRYLERFYLDGTTPVWWYACADALLEKRVWMEQVANATYVQYTFLRGSSLLSLSLELLVNYRDYHGATLEDINLHISHVPSGLQITRDDKVSSYFIRAERGEFTLKPVWEKDFSLAIEQYRGFDGLENHLSCGEFKVQLKPAEGVILVVSLDANADLDGHQAYSRRVKHESNVVDALPKNSIPERAILERLALAADQFIVSRSVDGELNGQSVIAGYPWFGDWGRDTMISLPGLTLATGRTEIAGSILRTFARFVDKGMLPNRFPDQGQAPEYNTVDATLWFFEAIRAYLVEMDRLNRLDAGNQLLHEIFPVLQEIIDWHIKGTRYHIHVDPQDGLIYAGEPGVQLTWMDAKVEDWVVTPRIGKPVEINALWYNALNCMVEFSERMGQPPQKFFEMAMRVQASFVQFWNPATGYCFDLLDGPAGNDPSLRPNQVFAVALPHSPLSLERAKSVVDMCASYLLTSHGLRSLAPFEKDYKPHYGGDLRTRDAAYHQGTVWSWLIGPFIRAHLRVYGDRRKARSYLIPLLHHLSDFGLGSVSEIFDGNPPFEPRGCFAQAWGMAELLRSWIDTCE